MGEYLGTVLLVLGDEDRPDALACQLQEAGLEAVTATADDALARLEGSAVDVLVASVGCGSPARLAAEALQRDPDIEVVVATGPDGFARALACLRAGASDLVVTPVDGEALRVAVTRAVERRRARGLAREFLGLARSTGLGQLTGSIAHEIANSVAILTSSLDEIARSLATLAELPLRCAQEPGAIGEWWERAGRQALELAREVMAEATEGAQRLKLLAGDLRGMARGDPAARSDVDVGEAIQAALRVARAELTGRVRVALDAPPRMFAHASHGALAQALVHLLVRAAQAMAAAGRRRGDVQVRARRMGAAVQVEVEDDVTPASADEAPRHLAPYLPAGALGRLGALGLAVARDLVERQGGSLQARPCPAGGTMFELRLPAVGVGPAH